MPLLPDDLIYPAGEIAANQFPDGDVVEAVGIWLAEAEEKTAHLPATDVEQMEDAQKAWVYYRAFSAVSRRIGATPSLDRTLDTQTNWQPQQAEYWQKRAKEALAEFQRLALQPIQTRGAQSATIKKQVIW